jgi:aryl-alcohol dehydrogenase-like predicted oxidoreductase
MGALLRLKETGKVQHLGLSNFTGELIRAAHAIAPVAAVQAEYNLLNLQAAADVLPTCRELGVPMVAYGPLAQGLLTGKFTAGAEFSADDRRHRLAHFRGADFARGLETAEQLRALGLACDQTPAQMALRWVLNSPGVACAVAGARTEEQVRQNAAACDALASGVKR